MSGVKEQNKLAIDTGLECVQFVLENRRSPAPSLETLIDAKLRRQTSTRVKERGYGYFAPVLQTIDELIAIGRSAGVDFATMSPSIDEISELLARGPAIASLNNGNFVVLISSSGSTLEAPTQLLVFDPLCEGVSRKIWITREEFQRVWSGVVLMLDGARRSTTGKPGEESAEDKAAAHAPEGTSEWRRGFGEQRDPKSAYGIGWFLKHIFQNKRYFADVVMLSALIHVLALAPPIFFQVVVDRVLVHNVFETLVALSVGVMLAIAFNAVFEFTRDRILLHAANRIDARILPETYDHLLSLKQTYFDQRSVGVLTKHMQQAETIREFLTGQLLRTLLNSSVLLIVLPLLFYYNSLLAWMTLAIVSVIFTTILALLFPLRRRLFDLYRAEGARQAMLVESLQGMSTVKSLALEDGLRTDWNILSAVVIEARHRVQKLQIIVETLIGFVDQALMVAIVVVGALFVIDGSMTVGALIAFQMLAGRVTGPLLQLIGLLHQAQEAAISVKMLGEVMNAPKEQEDRQDLLQPVIDGSISIDNVTYTYPGSGIPALERLRLDIRPGEFIGVVGRSGSGKTTLTRLLLGGCPPDQGAVLFGGQNMLDIDIHHLRRQISVVLQETFLFNGTVLANIRMARPQASLEEIREAAHIAGALDFIEDLPQRFDTWLEEGASNLSGGQRQRIGLARAIVARRPILILDEATSALDPESEASVRDRLPLIRRGRTLILVSHRLSLLKDADAIITLEAGRRMQIGRHADLVKMPGIYAQLWNQQAGPYQSPQDPGR